MSGGLHALGHGAKAEASQKYVVTVHAPSLQPAVSGDAGQAAPPLAS